MYRQAVGITINTICAPQPACFYLCAVRQSPSIDAFTNTCRYLDDIFNY